MTKSFGYTAKHLTKIEVDFINSKRLLKDGNLKRSLAEFVKRALQMSVFYIEYDA